MHEGDNSLRERKQAVFGKHRSTNEAFQRFSESNDAREIFSPGAAFIFMAATQQNWVEAQRRFDKERASPFRTVKFVGADRDQVGVELGDTVEWFLAKPLYRVGVEEHTTFLTERPQFGNGLNRTAFVVRCHDRDEDG